jgi:hypothetical protein
MLDQGIKSFLRNLNDQLASLETSPNFHGWDPGLTADQTHLLRTLRNTTKSKLKGFVARLLTARKHPIILMGPSGVGKTCVALRLAGKTPDRVTATKDKTEKERFVADLKAINVYSPPGTRKHGDYLDTITPLMTAKNAPGVVCMVVCAGFHSTADPDYLGTMSKANFDRPGRTGRRLATLQEFRAACLKEEVVYLNDVFDRIQGKMKTSIPWVITIVNMRDLWWKYKSALVRYTKDSSTYGRALAKLRGPAGWGAPDASTTEHTVFPAYLVDDGFGPAPSTQGTALRQAHMEADALILRALVFNKYSRGGA